MNEMGVEKKNKGRKKKGLAGVSFLRSGWCCLPYVAPPCSSSPYPAVGARNGWSTSTARSNGTNELHVPINLFFSRCRGSSSLAIVNQPPLMPDLRQTLGGTIGFWLLGKRGFVCFDLFMERMQILILFVLPGAQIKSKENKSSHWQMRLRRYSVPTIR